jgi:hypothetical protein
MLLTATSSASLSMINPIDAKSSDDKSGNGYSFLLMSSTSFLSREKYASDANIAANMVTAQRHFNA